MFAVNKIFFLFFTLFAFSGFVFAQEEGDEEDFDDEENTEPKKPKKQHLNGYVKYLETISFQNIEGNWLTNELIHNRLNYSWIPNKNLKLKIEARNRIFYGETVKLYQPFYAELIDQDPGLIDASFNLVSDSSYFINSTIDRANIEYSNNKFAVKIGRQRINWGQNFVWNPNDIFNSYSFFDFDYEERPGIDGILLQKFLNETNSLQFAMKFTKDFEKTIIATMYRFNYKKYDWQLIAAKFEQEIVAGFGWAGNIKGMGFTSEVTYFHPYENLSDTSGNFMLAFGSSYVFLNQTYAGIEIIYNGFGNKNGARNFSFNQAAGVKNLIASKWNILAQASFPVTPLIGMGTAGIVNPVDGSFFVGPSFTFSLQDNLELLLSSQAFFGNENTEYGSLGNYIYGRFRWSF